MAQPDVPAHSAAVYVTYNGAMCVAYSAAVYAYSGAMCVAYSDAV